MKVTISTVTDSGVLPQFYQRFAHHLPAVNAARADDYERDWRALAAKAGVLIRVDREVMV